MKYPDDFINQIICGNCIEVMKGISDNCIDTIITDPPYGLSFMGKDWDNFKNSRVTKSQVIKNLGAGMRQTTLQENINFMEWTSLWAKEALRVLKPGGTMLCFAGSRTQHLVAFGIELAGWILKDCIMWLYGSGFPKATDIAKQVEGKILYNNSNTTEFRKIKGKTKRIVSGYTRMEFEQGNKPANYNDREGESVVKPEFETPEAQQWNGWKSHGLKPAYEPILVAMKPNEGSYANNALKWGVAGLNIDGGRIGHNEPLKETKRQKNMGNSWDKNNCGLRSNPNNIASASPQGRFPANVILNEEAGEMLDEQTQDIGNTKPHKVNSNIDKYSGWGSITKKSGEVINYDEPNGKGASRFFYCAKASKAERNRGCEDMNIPEYRWNNAGVCKQIKGKKGNFHPTVKPLSLMKYLVTITKTPTGGIVLDPFCGSGTTLMACKELKRDYIGIDDTSEYCEIARRRIKAIPETLF